MKNISWLSRSAAEWGDMEAFLWKGRLRIISQGKKCSIRLEDSATGKTLEREREIDTEKCTLDHFFNVIVSYRGSICIVPI